MRIWLERELNKDGTKGEFEGLNNVSWNDSVLKRIEEDTGIVDNTISVVVEKINKSEDSIGYELRVFKNNVYYGNMYGMIGEKLKITVPENIGNTREEHFNYAKPIIETMYKKRNTMAN